MSATEFFLLRNRVSEELTANSYKPEEAARISRSLSRDALSLIAELGLEVASRFSGQAVAGSEEGTPSTHRCCRRVPPAARFASTGGDVPPNAPCMIV